MKQAKAKRAAKEDKKATKTDKQLLAEICVLLRQLFDVADLADGVVCLVDRRYAPAEHPIIKKLRKLCEEGP